MAMAITRSKYYDFMLLLSERYKPGDMFTVEDLHNVVSISGGALHAMCNNGLLIKVGKVKRQNVNGGDKWVNQYTIDKDVYDKVLRTKKHPLFLDCK